MVPSLARRPALVAAVAALALAAGRADELPPPPAAPVEPARPDYLRPALKRVADRHHYLDTLAGFEPFDLRYLTAPPDELGCVVGFRPAAVLAHPDAGPLARLAEAVGRQFARAYLPSGDTPLGAFESVVMAGRPDIRFSTIPDPAPGQRPHQVMFGGAFECVVCRTRAAQDWPKVVDRWFPGSRPASHNGEGYFVIPASPHPRAVYLPDARIAVIGGEEAVRKLIDRLRAGGTIAPPVGWSAVERGLVAVAFHNPDPAVWAAAPAGLGPKLPNPIGRVLRTTERFTLGLDAGRRARVRVIGWSSHPGAAGDAAAAAAGLLRWVREPNPAAAGGSPDPAGPFDGLLRGTLTLRPLGFEYAAEVPVDLIRELSAAADRLMAPAYCRPDMTPPTPPGVTPAGGPAALPPIPPLPAKGDWYTPGK